MGRPANSIKAARTGFDYALCTASWLVGQSLRASRKVWEMRFDEEHISDCGRKTLTRREQRSPERAAHPSPLKITAV